MNLAFSADITMSSLSNAVMFLKNQYAQDGSVIIFENSGVEKTSKSNNNYSYTYHYLILEVRA